MHIGKAYFCCNPKRFPPENPGFLRCFCRKAGFSGLQDLKLSLSGETFTPLESVFQDIKVDDSVEYIAKKLFGNIGRKVLKMHQNLLIFALNQ